MKPPAEIESFEELVQTFSDEWGIEQKEAESIIGRVVIEMSKASEINLTATQFLRHILSEAYREAGDRHRKRNEFDSKNAENELREEKGGILKNSYPNSDPENWVGICQERFCGFDRLTMENKVDEVLCPECSRELWIEPA
jgi:hypothetical protein